MEKGLAEKKKNKKRDLKSQSKIVIIPKTSISPD
jgi:hypothetical protein